MAKILVMEDSAFQRRLLVLILEAAGHTVLQAANGEEGLRIAETGEPECILLDLNMPDMSGLQVLQLLRDRHVDTPAVVFSADTEDTTKQQCLERGAAAFVIKSPDGNELLGVIAEILRSKNGGKRQNDA